MSVGTILLLLLVLMLMGAIVEQRADDGQGGRRRVQRNASGPPWHGGRNLDQFRRCHTVTTHPDSRCRLRTMPAQKHFSVIVAQGVVVRGA